MSHAQKLAEAFEKVAGFGLPIGLKAWDGSTAGPGTGPGTGPVAVLNSPRALRWMLWYPAELALAHAYVSGDLDVIGDLGEGLRTMWTAAAQRTSPRRGRARALASAARLAWSLGVVGAKPKAPEATADLDGEVNSRDRDRAAIGHHYDLSNRFYGLLLDPTMAYSCAYWTRDEPGYGLEQAQRDKLDLVCRKLGLRPGMRLLDVGCGWGSLSLYAGLIYGVEVTALTLSRQQHAHVRDRVADLGLGDRVEVHHLDWRDLPDGDFDAVAAIEMGEHVGEGNYPRFAERLGSLLVPGGRLLIQQMSRAAGTAPGGGPFIETYIAPDMHMRPVGRTVDILESRGLEVRDVEAMREHYVRTVDVWIETLEERWGDFVALAGVETARVWRLYLIGGRLAFEQGRMGVDQILAVRPGPLGASGVPATRAWALGEVPGV
ncbi:SAM-dependent methyltransferase [Phytomonospora endophytica]|uniref:Cyclopropane-fatty-acyl-phospholipid synthase n=1 Tax=Phytomonospora endophytica TaxID=714109 RepID=A0A841FZ08_9ACTN|nr:cyclopropane-fatty-acyl-phospholipid synthase family protein [Phytomonospora endophytica]MBB6038587.1 cyclopropane-fatty-acyl-phospholipid synthase [Phytomonospora endophytica]GIG69270.1 cyclopropane-fatty-acyl-phospholipid synthase [Phytomonospora endophytica]